MRGGNYNSEELECVVREYVELDTYRHKDFVQIRMMDVSKLMKHMPMPIRMAVFYHGVANLSLEDTGEIMGVSKQSAWKRFHNGLRWLEGALNGGT